TETTIPVNGTISGTNSTEVKIPIILPNATESWKFDTQVNGSRFIGDVYIQETDSSLILDGDGYVSNDGNSTSDISNLSVTAWVNPDYSGGSSEFTVVSKEKSFALTINNNIKPEHVAKFAVFDGIKWHTVETVTQIGNNWSHIAGTFNGTTLSIYTNGTISNVNESVETISISLDGQLEPKTIETVTSTSDVVIGASLENQRTVDDVTKQFHGEIKEINIFDVYLSSEQILEIYLQTLPIIESLYNTTTIQIVEEEKEIVIVDVLKPKIITNSTIVNATNIDITNTTDTSITFNDTQNYIPVIDETLNEELNKLTVSTWINPDYTSGSAEFAVVSKENSFVLGINNIYSPEKVPTLAIFDGIKWTKITGVTQITDWSHLVAVINGTNISLYLNGNLEAQTTLPESFVILDGEMSPTSAEIAENDSDLIIGAYLSTLRSKVALSNHFSGTINDVLVYKDALSQAQINQIYSEMTNHSGIESSIPFESQLLSFTDHVTIMLNNATISETILVSSVNSTSTAPVPFESIGFVDYVSYKLNGSTKNFSVDVMNISDVVVATLIPADTQNIIALDSLSFNDSLDIKINDESINQQNEISLIESISFEDYANTSLNGIFDVMFTEILSLNATIITSNYTTPTNNILSNIELDHNTIEVGKSVIWTHNVTFSNNTDSVAIEIPADAEILSIKTINSTNETVIFDSKDYELIENSTHTSVNGLYDDTDISNKDLKKYFRLLDSVVTIQSQINETNSKIAYYANLDTAKAHKKLDKLDSKLDKLEEKLDAKLDKLSAIVPMASLQQVRGLLQEDKPLKVLLLNDTAENLELTFMTPAPYTQESDNSTNGKYAKKVTVAHDSALHYSNVTAFSPIPENLVTKGVEFSLFWNINGSKVDVTTDDRFAVEFVDTDGNGIEDQMQWIVPQLSEQEFDIEADITIINVQSYPVVGGTWKVRFTTNGTADLIITASNGTTYGDALPDDLKFLELNNGTHTLIPEIVGESYVYRNYTSTEEGFEISRVMTPGKHHIMFQFGNDVMFAHNSARVVNGPDAFLMHGTPNFLSINSATTDTEDNMIFSSGFQTLGWPSPADREDPIFSHTNSPCTSADSCDVVSVSEAGMYRINYGMMITQDAEQRYGIIGMVQNDTDGTGGFGTGGSTTNFCYDGGFTRTSNGITETAVTGECLMPLAANGEVRIALDKISDDGPTANPSFNTNENWFHIQKVKNPTAILRTTTDQNIQISSTTTPHIMTFGTSNVEQIDSSTFAFNDTADSIVVKKDGAYKVTYSVLLDNLSTAGAGRFQAIGLLQTNSTGSYVTNEYGRDTSYLRETDSSNLGAVSASTILELSAFDAVKVGVLHEDDFTSTIDANRYHLDIEYLGALSDIQILRLHNSVTELDLDTTQEIQWDTGDEIDNDFTFTPGASATDITVERDGLYHVSYGITTIDPTPSSARTVLKTSLLVDSGSGPANAEACFGSAYTRGLTSGSTYDEAAHESSCYIELNAGDVISVQSLRSSTSDTDLQVIADQTWLTVQSLTLGDVQLETLTFTDEVTTDLIKGVSVSESLTFSDGTVEVTKFGEDNLQESLSFTDAVDTTKAASVDLTESLTFVDGMVIKSAGLIIIALEETMSFSVNAQGFPITDGTYFGDNLACLGLGWSPGTVITLKQIQNSCTTTTSVTTNPGDDSVVKMVTFYNGTIGNAQNTIITGKEIGNDINANFAAFTGDITVALVEMNIGPVTENAELDSMQITDVQEIQGNIDLSELNGVVSAGKQFGIKISMKSSNAGGDDLQVVWGKDTVGNQRFMVDVISATQYVEELEESLTFTDQFEKTYSVTLTETLSFTDSINLDAPISLFETLTFVDSVTKFVSLSESLSISDEVSTAVFGPIIGSPTSLFGLNDNGACVDEEDHSSPVIVTLGTSYNGCSLQDQLFLTSSTSNEENLALFYLPYAYNAEAKIQGLSAGNEIGFRTRDLGGTLNLKLVQVDISGAPSIDSVIATKSIPVSVNTWQEYTDISGLSGIIEEGFALGFQVTFEADTSDSNRKYLRWGTQPGANDREFHVELDVQLTKSLTESLTMNDKVNLVIPVSLTESLGISDNINKQASVQLEESLTFTDAFTIMKQAAISLDESLSFTDTVDTTKSASVSLTESITFTDNISQTASVSLTESLSFTDNISQTASVSLTESLSFTDAVDTTKAASVDLTES
ncbi:LamG domain-containing protein, partial [Nitrosopumilus sp.]|uniref:LamG domain-containing protein n=1 Tax=Nitrosopumilus sp. TaxID=2024843 RepID=UPI00247C5A85